MSMVDLAGARFQVVWQVTRKLCLVVLVVVKGAATILIPTQPVVLVLIKAAPVGVLVVD
jgi:hypothetical protein